MSSPVRPAVHGNRITPKGDNFSDIRKIFRLLLQHWYLFIIFFPLSLGAAWLYHQNTLPVYRASITMLFKSDQQRTFSSSVLVEGFGTTPEMRGFENQSFIIRSNRLVRRAVDRLDFGVSYYIKGRLKDTEIYKTQPFEIRFDSAHVQLLQVPLNFSFLADGTIQFSVKAENGGTLHQFSSGTNSGSSGPVIVDRRIDWGEKVEHSAFSFSIHPSPGRHMPNSGQYYAMFNSHANITGQFRSLLSVSAYREGSSIMFISLTGHQPHKMVRFLNVFSEEIILNNLERKNDMANRSIEFIQRQLMQVSDTLKVTQQSLMDFRRENRFMMPSDVSQRLSGEFFDAEKRRRDLNTSYGYFELIRKRLNDNNLDETDYLLPAFSSEPAGIVQQFVTEHLGLLKEMTLTSTLAGASNPYKQELERKIELSRRSLLSAIDKQMENIRLQQQEINRLERELTFKIGDLPELERDFLALERSHKLNDAIYTFLLQKSSEMQIAKASNVPDNEVLDQAAFSGPISPNKRGNYSRAMMAGLLIPALIIGILELFNTRIRTRDDLNGLFPQIPLVGTILRNKDGNENVVLAQPGSVIAESFRSLRARLRFLLSQNPGKVITVTSTNTGEGKTFCAVNLASVFAISGKKTVVVGFDLRKPRLSRIFGFTSQPGISNYLIGQVELNDIVHTTSQDNLFAIPAGVIPPNPSELISNDRVNTMFEELRKQYDVVVVDTPPVGLVSDGRLLMDYADCHLYVVRAGVTNKEHLNLTLANLVAENVPCMGLVLNDVSSSPHGYGYYGSGYFE
jgi:capsular exopolysaccharide synthesis family protein